MRLPKNRCSFVHIIFQIRIVFILTLCVEINSSLVFGASGSVRTPLGGVEGDGAPGVLRRKGGPWLPYAEGHPGVRVWLNKCTPWQPRVGGAGGGDRSARTRTGGSSLGGGALRQLFGLLISSKPPNAPSPHVGFLGGWVGGWIRSPLQKKTPCLQTPEFPSSRLVASVTSVAKLPSPPPLCWIWFFRSPE